MRITDNRSGFGLVSIVNHWIAAALMLLLLGIAMVFDELPRGDARSSLMALHVSIGALAALYLAFRVVWHFAQARPDPLPAPRWQLTAASFIQNALLLVIAILLVTGPLIPWAEGRDLAVFNWFSVPAPFAVSHDIGEMVEELHEIAGKPVLILLVAVHAAGALKHALLDRDNTLSRMLRPAKN